MTEHDQDSERPPGRVPPSQTGKTVQGMPKITPSKLPVSEEPAVEAAAPDEEGSRRSPWDGGRVTMDFTGPPLSLPPEKGRGEAMRSRDASSDAWVLDRKRRSTPPVGTPAVVVETPMPPPGSLHPAPASRDWDAPPSLPSSETGDALGLVDRAKPSHVQLDLEEEMAERYALDDFTGALRTAELLLGSNPEHAEALNYAQSCRKRLEQLYSSRLGSLDRHVEVAVPEREIRWLGLDHRAGFLLSRIDGSCSIEEIIDMSGMAHLEALKTLAELLDIGAIRLAG